MYRLMYYSSLVYVCLVLLVGCNDKHDKPEVVYTSTSEVLPAESIGEVITNLPPETGITDREILSRVHYAEEFNDPTVALPSDNERAVIFGDNYPGLSMKLNGCKPDAINNALYLVRFENFKPEDIILVLNEQCTKVNYVRFMKWSIADITEGSKRLTFIGNSSHGAQGTNSKGVLCEIWVPFNFDWDDESTWFTDKEVYEILKNIPPSSAVMIKNDMAYSGPEVIIFNDMCHAEDAQREVYTGSIADKKSYQVKRLIPPPEMRAKNKKAIRTRQLELNILYFAACEKNSLSDDTSDDYGNPGGAFTIGIHSVLRLGITRVPVAVNKEVNKWMDAHGYTQNPSVRGPTANGLLFRNRAEKKSISFPSPSKNRSIVKDTFVNITEKSTCKDGKCPLVPKSEEIPDCYSCWKNKGLGRCSNGYCPSSNSKNKSKPGQMD